MSADHGLEPLRLRLQHDVGDLSRHRHRVLEIEMGRVGQEGLKQDGITVSDTTLARSTPGDP